MSETATGNSSTVCAAHVSAQPTVLIQPPPTENLIGIDAMRTRHSLHRSSRLKALFDHPPFLRDRISAPFERCWSFPQRRLDRDWG